MTDPDEQQVTRPDGNVLRRLRSGQRLAAHTFPRLEPPATFDAWDVEQHTSPDDPVASDVKGQLGRAGHTDLVCRHAVVQGALIQHVDNASR